MAVKGKALAKGEKIGLTAPAGPVGQERLGQAVLVLEEMGFKVEIGFSCRQKYQEYLAGKPEDRAKELNWMFANPTIAAIWCLRGGYGSPQILPLLDYDLIGRNPKLLVGYSDITALHIALQQKCHLPTLHGPMPASDLIEADSFTKHHVLKLAMGGNPPLEILNPGAEQAKTLVPGEAAGILTGGNLAIISCLMGTPYELDARDKILFLEDVGEEPYKIDRMLTQLAMGGKFSDAAGVMLGSWTDCGSEHVLEEIFERIIAPYGKPVLYHIKAGHCSPMLTLPMGVKIRLNASAAKWNMEESACFL